MQVIGTLQVAGIFTLVASGFVTGAGRTSANPKEAPDVSCEAVTQGALARLALRGMNAIDLRSLPVSARRSLVSRLPAETQRELWRAHLAHIATRAGDASLERRIAINALDYLPRLFDSEIAVTHRAALARQLWTEAASALGRERSADIFFALGSRDAVSRASQFDPKYPQVAWAVFEGEPLQQAFASFASGIALCVCSTYYQDCTSAPECTESSNPHCGHTEQGCGPMWLAACDGSCNS